MVGIIERDNREEEEQSFFWTRSQKFTVGPFDTADDLAAFEGYVTDATNAFDLSTRLCKIYGVLVNRIHMREKEPMIIGPDYFRREGAEFILRGALHIPPTRPKSFAARFEVVKYEAFQCSVVKTQSITINGEEVNAEATLAWHFDFGERKAVLTADARCFEELPWWMGRGFANVCFDTGIIMAVGQLVNTFDMEKIQEA